MVAAYTGTAVNALTLLATNFNMGATPSFGCCISFAITQGTVYSLQVTGYGGVTVDFRIAVAFVWAVPRNDAFSAAETTFPASGTTLGATLETGERVAIIGRGASGSVWYSFSAASNGTAQVCHGGCVCMCVYVCICVCMCVYVCVCVCVWGGIWSYLRPVGAHRASPGPQSRTHLTGG
jgi:hypothetical protein